MAATKPKLIGGRYEPLERLGHGGMASVWLARDQRLERSVAVKLLHPALAEDDAYCERFRREACVAARLRHPRLIGVFDYGVDAERPYLVMEHIAGQPLAALGDDGPAPEALARALLEALDYMHGEGVVHRDIKPSNVIIDGDGEPHLTDFGIAQPDGATSLTLPGQVVGTAGYVAPECIAGDPASPRSDLYSLGVLLCRTGARADWTPPLRRLVRQLNERAPERRPPSARAALALLDSAASEPTAPTAQLERTRVLPQKPLAQERTLPRRRSDPPGRAAQRRLAAVLAGVLVILALAALIPGSGSAPPQRRAPGASSPLQAQLDRVGRDLDGLR